MYTFAFVDDTWLLAGLYLVLLEQHSYFMYRLVKDNEQLNGYLGVQLLATIYAVNA